MDVEYKIIGGDGVEYGPASLDELQNWIGDGRVAGTTQVWRSDLALWSPAARYVELQQALARLHASVAPSLAQAGVRPVGFWPRVAAYLLDRMVLVMIFFGLLWGPLAQWRHWEMVAQPTVLDMDNLTRYATQVSELSEKTAPFLYALNVLYDVLMTGAFGATVGKMAIGARIVNVDGTRLGYPRALLRSLTARLVEFGLCVGYLWVALRPDKRGLHDLLAKTKVVFQR